MELNASAFVIQATLSFDVNVFVVRDRLVAAGDAVTPDASDVADACIFGTAIGSPLSEHACDLSRATGRLTLYPTLPLARTNSHTNTRTVEKPKNTSLVENVLS